jgi:uncharacterized protein
MPEISANTAVVDNFFRAVERGDIEAVRAIYSPDVAIWHNDGAGDQDLEANLVVLRLLSGAIQDMHFAVSRRVDVGDGIFQHHVLRGQLPNGEPCALDAAMYLALEGGRITRIEEFFDVATVTHMIDVAGATAEA